MRSKELCPKGVRDYAKFSSNTSIQILLKSLEAAEEDLERLDLLYKQQSDYYVILRDSAKERYDKAYKFAEIQCCAGLVCIDLATVDEALKIASGYEQYKPIEVVKETARFTQTSTDLDDINNLLNFTIKR